MFGYSEKKLAKDIGRLAQRFDADLSAHYVADAHRVDLRRASEPETPPYQIFLGNLFLKVKAMRRAERDDILQAFLADALSPKLRSADELIAALALRVRTPWELALRHQMIAIYNDPPEFITYGDGELVLELVADNEESVGTVPLEDLQAAEISVADAFKAAAATLVRASDGAQWSQQADHVWLSTYSDDYDFARLVVAGDALRLPFSAAPIVFAPSHSVCLVADETGAGTLARLIEIGNKLAETHRPLSQLLWTRSDDGRWLPLELEPEDDGYSQLRMQRVVEQIGRYEDQKHYLESLLESRGEDSFVAAYQVYERDDALHIVSTYTLDVPSYLPHTEQVVIVDPNRKSDQSVLGSLSWADFAETLGPQVLQPMPDMSPPRFSLLGALTGDQRERLLAQLAPI